MILLSCQRLWSNEVRLWLSVIAHNPGNLRQRLASPRRIKNWSLTNLQQWLVKTGRPPVKPARYHWLLLAEGHLNRRLFGTLLGLIVALPQRGDWENIREGNLAAQKSSRGKSATSKAGWRWETDQTRQRKGQSEPRCHPKGGTARSVLKRWGSRCLLLGEQGRTNRKFRLAS
jgi:hypothetical protein